MADRISKARRSWNMSRIRGKNTKPELQLRSALHKAGFRFRLHDRKLPGKPDIVLRQFKTVILVHGCYWHRHPGCAEATTPKSNVDFWTAKFDATVERDRRNIAALEAAGWRVLVVWECEIKADLSDVVSRISGVLKPSGR